MVPKQPQSQGYLDGCGHNLGALSLETIRRNIQRRQRPHILDAICQGYNSWSTTTAVRFTMDRQDSASTCYVSLEAEVVAIRVLAFVLDLSETIVADI